MEDSLMNSPSRTLRSMLRGLQEVITPTDTPELLRDAKDNNLHLGSLAEGDSNFHSSRTKDPSNIGQNDLTYGNLSLMNETDVSDDTLSKLSLKNIRMKLRSRKHAPSTSDNVHLPPKTPDVSTTSDQTYGHNVFTFDSTDDSIRQEKLEEFVRTKRRRKVKTENLELPNKTPDISIGKDQTYAHTSMSDSSDDTIQYEEAEELVRKRRKRKIDSAEDVDINYNISNLPKWNDVSSGSKSLGSESKRTRGLKSTSSALPEITVSHIQDSSTIHSDDTSLGSEDQIKTRFSKARKSIKLDLAHIIEKIDDKKDSNDSNQGQPVSSNTTVETPRKSPRTRSSFQTSASLINNLSIPRSTGNLTSSTTLDRYVEVETLASPTMVPSKLLQKSPPRTNLSTYIEPKQSPKSVTIAPPSSPSLAPSTPGLHPDDNLSTSSISSMTESFESVVNPGIKSQLNRKRKSVKLDLDDIIAGMKTSQNSSERRAEKTPVDTACSQGTGVINQIDEENYESVSGRSEVVQTPKSKTLNNDSLEVSSAEDSVNYLKNKSLGDESEKSRRVSLKNTDAEKTPNKSSSRESSRNASMQESPANSLRNKSLRSVSLTKSPASSPRNKSLRNTDAEKTPTKSPSRESSRNASMQESPANSLRNKSLRSVSLAKSPASSPRNKSLRNTDAEKTPTKSPSRESSRNASMQESPANSLRNKSLRSVSLAKSPASSPRNKSLRNTDAEKTPTKSPSRESSRNASMQESPANSLRNKSLRSVSLAKSPASSPRNKSLRNTDAEKTPTKSPSRESSRNASMQESPANSLRNKSLRSVSLAKSPASSPRNKSLRNTDAEKTPTKSPSRESSRNASMQESPANSLRNKSLRNIDTEESPDKFSRKVLRNLSVEMSPANSPRSKSLKNTSLGDSPDNSPRSTSSENLPSSGASPDIASDDSPRRRSSKYLSPSELPDKNKSSASVSHSQKVISSREISSNQSSKNLSSADTQENLSFSKSKTDVVNPELRRRSSTPYSLRSTPRKNAAKYLDASFDKSTIKSPSKRALSPPTSPSRKLQSSPAASPNKITRLGDMNSPDKSGDILNNSRRSQRKSLNKSKATTDFPESVPEKSQILADSSNESSSTEMDVLPDKSQREIKESQFPSLNKSSGTPSLGSFLSSSNERGFPMEKDNQYERYSMVSPQRSEKLVESLLQQDSALPNTSVKQSRASPMPPNIDGTSASLQSPSKVDGNKQKKSTEKSQISLNASKNISRKEVTVLRNQSKIASEPKETGESQDQSSDVNDPSNKPKEATKQLSLKEFLERMSKGALPQQKEKPKTFLDLIQQPSIPSTSQTKTIKPPSRKPKVGKKTNSGNFPQKLNRNWFQHFSTRKVSNEAAIMFHDAMEVFLKNLSSDLEVIATAKKEKSISKNHIFILMKQLGLVSSWNEVYAKVQEFLPYEDWEKLIPTEYAFKRVLP